MAQWRQMASPKPSSNKKLLALIFCSKASSTILWFPLKREFKEFSFCDSLASVLQHLYSFWYKLFGFCTNNLLGIKKKNKKKITNGEKLKI